MVRQVLAYALVGALIAAGAASSVLGVCPSGDANGDRRVDVLDLQAVIAQVLESGEDSHQADVNSDGCVDIRDYQCILARAEKAGHEGADTDNTHTTAVLSSGHRLDLTFGVRRIEYTQLSADDDDAASRTHEAASQTASPKTEHCVSRLSPRAPPVVT